MEELRAVPVGAVVIGRNEGERLKRCLRSILRQIETVVYVDSGSTDGSVEFAQSLGVKVVDLDMSRPFSAGRARNAGFAALTETRPDVAFVQFIDGDCELCDGWVDRATAFLTERPEYAMTAGRVKERNPENSIYNELCDMEWNLPVGESLSSGGIFMVRAEAFTAVGGFNAGMIAGEEPEYCYRLRRAGWRIYNLDALMTLHDADMRRFSQWWKRTVRTGYAYAHRYFLHVGDNDTYLRLAAIRIWAWAFALPVLTVVSCVLLGPWGLLFLLAYPLQFYRSYKSILATSPRKSASFRYAFFTVLGKWPQLVGQITFLRKKLMGQAIEIIEYK